MGQTDSDLNSFSNLIDLASERFGGRAVAANDEFFAPKENLLKPGRAVFIPDKYTDAGKWMDGWETRRRRTPGHDWCTIALGKPGALQAVTVDTSHFKGNQPESCTVEAAELAGSPNAAALNDPGIIWTPLIPQTTLNPDSEHAIPVLPTAQNRRFTHVRLNIFPDGGVARLRVHGRVIPDWKALAASGKLIDLAAAENGAMVIACNDMHFGSGHNLIMPGRAKNMGEGWETRRRRGPGFDWIIIRLGHRGTITEVEVDTNHYKGNFPESCMIETCDAPKATTPGNMLDPAAVQWSVLLPRTKLEADKRHLFDEELDKSGSVSLCTHARLNMYPDGGISRMRLWGSISL